jgi:hypothetical protein
MLGDAYFQAWSVAAALNGPYFAAKISPVFCKIKRQASKDLLYKP